MDTFFEMRKLPREKLLLIKRQPVRLPFFIRGSLCRRFTKEEGEAAGEIGSQAEENKLPTNITG